MAPSYEDLMGGFGRRIFFRAHRYAARELLERVRPLLYVDGKPHEIHDLSMNGISCYAPFEEDALEVGRRVAVFLKLDEVVAYEGEGQISRQETTSKGKKVAVRITKGFLDIPKLVAMQEELALHKEVEAGVANDLDRISADYLRVCAEVVYLMRRYRSLLDRYERHVASGCLGGAVDLDDYLLKCQGSFRSEWNQLRARSNPLVWRMRDDLDQFRAAKRFTESMVTPEFMAAPLWRRSYQKPLGYPGDYEIMNYFYSGKPEGDSAFARMVHRIGLEHPNAVSVCQRMRMICDAIAETVERTPVEAGPVRITSLGCGPAREVQEYLEQVRLPRPVHFSLIDQDDRALSYAYAQVYPRMHRCGGEICTDCLYLSFAQLLKNPKLLDTIGPQHLIYSAGLFDYLPQPAARALMAGLYQRLAPGGLLVVGNLKAPTDAFWVPEFVLDWVLVHRTREEMLALAQGLEAAVELRTDPTGYMYLLYVRRR